MKMSMVYLIAILIFNAAFYGCATKEDTGTLAGAVAGAALGSTVGKGSGRVAAIWLGTVLGSQLGRAMGEYMDEQDRYRTAAILENNKTNQGSSWRNPDTDNYYRVTPTRTYSRASEPCREFTVDANVGGKDEQLYGTACR